MCCFIAAMKSNFAVSALTKIQYIFIVTKLNPHILMYDQKDWHSDNTESLINVQPTLSCSAFPAWTGKGGVSRVFFPFFVQTMNGDCVSVFASTISVSLCACVCA